MALHNGTRTEHGPFIWIFYGFEAELIAELNSKVATDILSTQQNPRKNILLGYKRARMTYR